MLKRLFTALMGLLLLSFIVINAQAATNKHVLVKTSLGNIELELFNNKAPVSVNNFLSYVDRGFYNQTIFHRVIPNFMIQGGGFTADMIQKTTLAPIKNEATNGLKNVRGTIAMARTQVIDSATSQFFINLVDNDFLDHSQRDFGYAVFGKVVKGMDVVDKIAKVKVNTVNAYENVPVEPVTILSIQRINSKTKK